MTNPSIRTTTQILRSAQIKQSKSTQLTQLWAQVCKLAEASSWTQSCLSVSKQMLVRASLCKVISKARVPFRSDRYAFYLWCPYRDLARGTCYDQHFHVCSGCFCDGSLVIWDKNAITIVKDKSEFPPPSDPSSNDWHPLIGLHENMQHMIPFT